MARKGKQHRSESQKQQFLAYNAEGRQEKNKIRSLARHVKGNPNDVSAASNLKRVKASGQTWKRNINRTSNFEPKRTQLQAELIRKTSTGATMRNEDGTLVNKPVPFYKRGRYTTLMTEAFNKIGITDGRIYRAMQASI